MNMTDGLVPTHPGLRYGDDSPRQSLDVYLTPQRPRAPLVLLIHGGAFRFGDKRSELHTVPAWLERGYSVASIGYRLSGEATFPAAPRDCAAALRWLCAHAADLGVDGGTVVPFGASAGGHLAAMLGVTASRPEAFGGDPAAGAAVAAVVDWFGPTRFLAMDAQNRERPPRPRAAAAPGEPAVVPMNHDADDSPESLYLGGPLQSVPDRARASDPTTYVPDAAWLPPFLVVHGDADPLVPHLQSVVLADALAAHGGQVDVRILPGYGHGGPEWVVDVLPATIAWVDGVLARR